MGKGSAPRPFSVSEREFADNFDRIFGKTKEKIEEQKKREREMEKQEEDELND